VRNGKYLNPPLSYNEALKYINIVVVVAVVVDYDDECR
jgi:hypothetical protein